MSKEKQVNESKNIVTIEPSGPCKKKVTVEIPEETIKLAMEEQYGQLKRDVVLPGFRKGRAPIPLLEKRFSKETSAQVKLKLLANASESAIKDNKLDTIGEPNVEHEKIELPEKGSMKFDFEVEVRPEFELPSLEQIPVTKTKIQVTDEEIHHELDLICKRFGIWAPLEDGKAQLEDQVIANVILKTEDPANEETLDNTEIIVSEKGFVGKVPVENLSKLLDGAKQGQSVSTTVEVPKTFYNEQYRGKKVDVNITVKDIKRLTPAAINDELFVKIGVKDEQELRDKIRIYTEGKLEQEVRSALSDQIYGYLLQNTSFDLPADVVADQSTGIMQRQYSNLLMRGLAREQIEQQMDQLRASSEERAKEQLKLFFIMDKIAEKFDIKVTEEEINGYIAQVAAHRGYRPERMREDMVKDGSLAQFTQNVREQKCVEKLLESAKVTEGEPETPSKEKNKAKVAKKTDTPAEKHTHKKESLDDKREKAKSVRKKKSQE